jgi:hypothetical protein
MPATYTVVEAEKISDKPDRGYGPMQTIRLKLRNEQGGERGGITWYTKATTQVPAADSQVFGDVKQGQYGWEFKKAQQGGYNGRSGAPRDFKADPVKQAAIAMEASQKAAVEIVKLAHVTERTPAEITQIVKDLAGDLFEQIQKVSEAAK